jgi:glycosyltransferase involved in cell wall biosynthesis
MKISLVILTLNEIVGLKEIFPKIPLNEVDEVIAVDGGSKDGTIEFLKEKNIPVYFQDIKGRGEAFRVAFRKATGDALILFSPDGNEDPNDIPKFKPLLEAGHDIVIATRMVKGAHNEEDEDFLRLRKWVNNAFTLIANILWNRQKFVTDTINGYRAITKKAWNELALDGPGYTIEFQGSIRAFKKKMKIAEFPTYENKRIDNGFGSPSLDTGVAFLKILFHEIKVGRRWKPLDQVSSDIEKKNLFRTFWNG